MSTNDGTTDFDRLAAIFERVTGDVTVTERQHQGISHRVYEDDQ